MINMSTGKRLAKRSILGTRVVAPGIDGRFYPAVIQSVKTISAAAGDGHFDSGQTAMMMTTYVVRFDNSRKVSEFRETELIGPGFAGVTSVGTLLSGQRIYVTYAGRELEGTVMQHDTRADIVTVSLSVSDQEKKKSYIAWNFPCYIYCKGQCCHCCGAAPLWRLRLRGTFIFCDFSSISGSGCGH